VGTYTVTGFTADLAAVGAADENTIYVCVASSTAPNNVVKKITLSYGPFSGSQQDMTGYGSFVKTELAANATYLAIGEAGGAEDGFGIATLSGTTATNVPPVAGLDSDADFLYDSGAYVMNVINAVVNVDMDKTNGYIYGYTGSDSATPTGGAVFRIAVAGAGVGNWSLY
jgi:hypothetical protein